ncbi:hypothetical protein EC973_007635 [Apophysomyces ossiformis]|uniref:Heterokaryon incompatibility domain-containing protein n=1 Tax=Apophysomyces ossiformis TaxID=679940 RepID=A0A8H7BTJ7_9FUNG|nr:hypothetical protein EC973_007635 [Apophysomyces ossiformis]
MSDSSDIESVWEAANKDISHELDLLWDQFKSDIALVHKDYDSFDLARELLPGCTTGSPCSLLSWTKCQHQKSFEKSREKHYGIIRERLHEKLCENICEIFRELRAISYDSGGSVSQRNRIENEIVLLDTRSEMNAIRCVSIPFDENVPAYYAISYRWGHHPEWRAQTPNYVASITSISQANLIKLCRYYRDRIRYMWIDVICINQSDRAHRKMAIKNMSNIYGRAKRIIGVPDLRYCKDNPFMEDVSREDIEAAIIKMCEGDAMEILLCSDMGNLLYKYEPGTYLGFRLDISELRNDMAPWNKGNIKYHDLDDYTSTKQRQGDRDKGCKFITHIILEWANRVWVVSERDIGDKGNKLLIHILRTNTVFYHVILFAYIWDVKWELSIPEHAFGVMFDCNSDKYIDRLYAILPQTEYKYAMEKVIDEDVPVNDEDDLKWLLFDILDTDGKNHFLEFLMHQRGEFSIMLPLPVSENEFPEWPHEIEESKTFFTPRYLLKIERLSKNGSHVLKVSCPFIYPYQPDNDKESQPSNAADVSEMFLIIEIDDRTYYGWQYRLSEEKDLWECVAFEPVSLRFARWKYGEFLLFQYPEDAFLW